MRNKVDVSDIEAFAAVGHALNFTVAANALNISASALSRRIQKLEALLDVRLLARTTREVKLTLQGKQFLSRTQDILSHIDELVTATKGEGARSTTTVTVAAIPSIVHLLLPDVIRAFHQRHPKTRIRIKDLSTNEIFDTVARGEADFGITSFLPHEANLKFMPLVSSKFVLATPRRHALARKRSVAWAELKQHPVISTWKGAGVRVAMDIDLAKTNSGITAFYEVQQIYTALRLVEAGLGIAAVPRFFIGRGDLERIAAVALVEPTVTAELGTVVSANHPLRHQALDLWTLTHEIGAKVLGHA
ncbi:MAG TPA: LysR substrate-binding domain-containing protein [Xanthobacteraceae bacterium]|jgi:DNA-binding transcriptional LysR family regulator|nr:LysR substrate-binding domain-containing protein [Xanthobacteraceae bacterium]